MAGIVLLLLIAAACLYSTTNGSPIPSSSPPAMSHSFDLGVLDSCVIPTSTQLGHCHQFIDYPVPAVLLSDMLLNIKHQRIMAARTTAYNNEMSAGNVSLADTCAKTALEHNCREEFPPCYGMQGNTTHMMVEFAPPGPCLSSGVNPCTYYAPSCGTPSANVSLTTCHLTSQLTDYNYTYCSTLSQWSSTYLTKWMHMFLQNVEQDIETFSQALNSDAARRVCVPLYAELRCGTVGRCSHQGTRAEMNATREVCNAVMSCVGSNLRDKISPFINCSHYPSITNKLPTQATPITPPTTAPPTAPPTNNTVTEETNPPITQGTQEPTVLFPDSPSRVTSSASSLNYHKLLILSTVILLLCIVL